jgi:hypothetical protein
MLSCSALAYLKIRMRLALARALFVKVRTTYRNIHLSFQTEACKSVARAALAGRAFQSQYVLPSFVRFRCLTI